MNLAYGQIFIYYLHFVPVLLPTSLRVLVIISDAYRSQNYLNNGLFVSSVDKSLLNLTFSAGRIYHHNGIAYDYYAKDELGQSNAGYQWRIWPLPNETNKNSSSDNISISSLVVSELPFVDAIYVLTDPRLTERHTNLKKGFYHQGIAIESIKWRMKWNRTTCNSQSNQVYVYKRLNLKNKPLGN